MRKKGLMELKPLKVMNRHIADAKKTEISLSTLENQRGEPGKYRMYCRAAVEKGILKVYLFAVTDIEENINFPRYRLFISRKERRFITYDEKLKKWKKALLESILWDVRINLGNIYVNDCDTKVIQKYLKTMQPAIRSLEEFQANIRKEQRIRHDKKLTDSWDQVMKTVSGLPKNWIGWVSKYGITEHYIFYKYQKNGATEGYCTYCKKYVPIRSPKYNQKGQCNVCGQPITFRSVGKSGRFCTKHKCCDFYGICYRSVMAYQNQYKCRTEEVITHFIELKKSKEIIFRNRKWASIKTCCEFYDLNEDSVKTDMWNRKCTPQEAIERAIEWKKAHEITYHGVKYPSLPQCCEDLEINPISVRLYMEKNGVSSTRAITHYIKSKEKRAFEFRGKEYKNFTECCLAYGLKPKSVSSAVFKAKRPHADVMEEIISHMEGCMPKEVTKKEEIPENQVMSKERHRAKEAFFYEGNKYISLGQCCEFYGINESSVRSRAWRKKCTWEEAVKYYIQKKETETPKMQFFYKGKRYKSVSACCAEYGVNASSVRNRAKTTECSIEESLDHFIKKARMETQPSVFIFRDKTYRSLEECCLEYGVNADSVSSRKYRLNCTMEESLEHFIENKDMIAERIQKFTFKGIEYRSLRACCQKYGIDDICVRQRARDKNCSLEESFTHFMTRKRKKMLSNPEFEYHGTVYPSLKVCCEELGINKSSVISRSHRAGCSLQEAVEYYVSQQERRTLD